MYSFLTGLKVTDLLGFDGEVSIANGILFEGDYVIIHGIYKISSFDRSSLDLEYTEKSTQKIYRMSLVLSLVALISDSVNDIVKLWNYKTGAML